MFTSPFVPLPVDHALAETGCPSLCQLLVPSKVLVKDFVPAVSRKPWLTTLCSTPLIPLRPLGPSLSSEHRALPDIGHSFICYSSLLPARTQAMRQKHGSFMLRSLAGCSLNAGVSPGCTPHHSCWGVCSARSCLWALIF